MAVLGLRKSVLEGLLGSANLRGFWITGFPLNIDETTSSGYGLGGARRSRPEREAIGPWLLEYMIGEGGFGHVYLATQGQRRAAVKTLPRDRLASHNLDVFLESFDSEVSILSRLSGPNTAELIEADLSGDLPWIATRFIAGNTLSDQVRYDNPVRGQAWWRLADGLFNGLAEAHDLGVIHRDVKPSNVMRSADTPAVLIDFGIGMLLESRDKARRAGTHRFSSPEQRRGELLTPASDVYSAALTLLYATTRPQDAERAEFTTEDAPGSSLIAEVLPGDSSEADLLRLALSEDPSDRPSARDLSNLARAAVALKSDQSALIDPAPTNQAPPMRGSDSEPVAMSLPVKIGMSVPTIAPPNGLAERHARKALDKLLQVRAGSVAQLVWRRAQILASVFQVASGRIVIELRADSGSTFFQDGLMARGWSRPEKGESGWILVLDRPENPHLEVATELIEALKLVSAWPETPEPSGRVR